MTTRRATLILSLLALAALLFSTSSANATATCVPLSPGDDIVTKIGRAADGTSFCLAPGTYHVTAPIKAQPGETISGPGAVIDGSVPLSGFTKSGTVWTAPYTKAPNFDGGGWGSNALEYPQAQYLDDVIVDGQQLWKTGVKTGGKVIGDPASAVTASSYFIDYDADQVILGMDPAGHDVEMTSVDTVISAAASNVTVSGVTLRGATGNGLYLGDGGTATGVTALLNHQSGIGFGGDNVKVLNSLTTKNGKYGISGTGTDDLVQGNEVSDNNAAHYAAADGGGCGAAGGSKFVLTVGLVVRGNDYHDNLCNGIWLDISNYDSLITQNRSVGNAGHGIREEISYTATISQNIVTDNTGGGITVNDSPDVTVTGNVIARNESGPFRFVNSDRSRDGTTSYGEHLVKNLNVHDNYLSVEHPDLQRVGGSDQMAGAPSMTPSWNNHFGSNTFLLTAPVDRVYLWQDRMNWSQWQAAGNDQAGRIISLDKGAPAAPGGFTQMRTQTSSTLSWQPSFAATDTALYTVSVDGHPQAIIPTPSYTVTGLDCSATGSQVTIAAYDKGGNASAPVTVNAVSSCAPDQQAPSAVSGLASSGVTASAATLSWTAATDDTSVAGYQLSVNGQPAGQTTLTGGSIAGLACESDLTLGVAAYDAAGNTAAPVTVSVHTGSCPDTQVPTAPAGLVETDASQTGVTLSWAPSSDNVGVAGYRVLVGGVVVADTATTSATIAGFACNTSKTMSVVAYDAAGNTSAAGVTTAKSALCPDVQAPTEPTGLTQTRATQTGFTVKWTASKDDRGVAGYRVLVDGSVVGQTTSSVHSFAVTSVSCGQTHRVTIAAYDAAGNTATSAGLAATSAVCPTVISGIAASPASFSAQTSVTYTFSSASTVTIVAIRNSTGGTTRVLVSAASQSAGSHSITWNGKTTTGGSAPTGTYTIRISATNASGIKATQQITVTKTA